MQYCIALKTHALPWLQRSERPASLLGRGMTYHHVTHACQVRLCARLQVGAPQIAVHSDLPVALGVVLNPLWRRDVLHSNTPPAY